jgi:hypothetical protein
MSWKLASTVRRGTFGKVPLDGNSLGVYPTSKTFCNVSGVLPVKARVRLVTLCVSHALFNAVVQMALHKRFLKID